jgi:hypothetical protein
VPLAAPCTIAFDAAFELFFKTFLARAKIGAAPLLHESWASLFGGYSFPRRALDFRSQSGQMVGKSHVHLLLLRIGCQIANQRAFRRFGTDFAQLLHQTAHHILPQSQPGFITTNPFGGSAAGTVQL